MPLLNQTFASNDDLEALGLSQLFLNNVPLKERESNLEAASALVASYLTAQFTMPLQSWGMDIKRATCIIATYDIAVKRGYNPEAGADPNLRDRYLDVIEWLKAISNGDVTPVVTDSSGGSEVPFVYSSSQRGWSIRDTGRDPGPFEGD